LDIRKKFFAVRVARHWNRSPREAVHAPSLAVFEARLGGALSNLVSGEMSLPVGHRDLHEIRAHPLSVPQIPVQMFRADKPVSVIHDDCIQHQQSHL